jgi:hypothetical protein
VTERSRRDRHSATQAQRNPAAWRLPGTAAGYHQVTLSKNLSNAAGDAERSAVNSEASSMHGKAKLPVSSAEGPHGGMVVICCPRTLRKHTIHPPRGGLSFGPPLSTLFQRTRAYEADAGRE